MIAEFSQSLSALTRLGKIMGALAHHVANTEGIESTVTKIPPGEEASYAGSENNHHKASFLKADCQTTRLSCLSQVIPKAVVTGIFYRSNLRFMRTEDEMFGSLLDIIE